MREGIRLTVIIPGYRNPRRYWERCLTSVLRDLSSADEVICVDDGSTDRPEFLQGMARKDSRIRVLFLEKNVGLPSARNAALKIARGEFVTFVDSDDEVASGIYEESITALERTHSDIAIYGVRSVWVSERLYKENIPEGREYGELTAEDVGRLYKNSLLNYAWNKVYRRDFLTAHRLSFDADGVPCEDIIFVLDCIVAKAKWVGVPSVGIVYYRAHNTLLSRYKTTYLKGTALANEAWRRYKRSDDGIADRLGQMGEVDDANLMRGEWDNIWRMGSPYSLMRRYRFAKEHRELYSGSTVVFFIKKVVYSFLRRWLYVRPIQRWHIQRIYPMAKDVA